MSNLYDGLALNTPTLVASNADVDVWATRTRDPLIGGEGTVEYRAKAGGATDNARQIETAAQAALVQLAMIKTQATTFAAQVPYATANLAALNDLLAKTQAMANAVAAIAQIERVLIRRLLGLYDAPS